MQRTIIIPSSHYVQVANNYGVYTTSHFIFQNTFQLVLATDGISSYAYFLYDDIQWSQTDPRRGNSIGSGSGGIGSGGSGDVDGSGSSLRLVQLELMNSKSSMSLWI